MNKKAQAGLEYLMTYGWALILVVTVIGVLVFIVSTPVSDVSFRSSDPTKIMLKSASALAGAVQIKLQNITGGKITITALSGDGFSGLIVNESSLPLEVGAGGELFIEGNGTVGTITIGYMDFAGIQRTVIITGGGGGTTDPAVFDPGSGTLEDPFNIWDCVALQAINDGDLGAYYQLAQSFSCSEIANFEPIGIETDYVPITPFTGSFDGQGFTISGLKINRSSESSVGLFGGTINASISNVGLIGVNITGNDWVGGLVGHSELGTITNSYSTGSVNGSTIVGGLIGNNRAFVTDSYSSVNVIGTDWVGGLIGRNINGISDCYSTGNVTGTEDYVGGLIGFNIANVTKSNHSIGTVTGVKYVGGLIGQNNSVVTTSYSSGNVIGTTSVGGLVGFNYITHIYNSYSTANVNGFNNVGGLVGYNRRIGASNGRILNSYSTGDATANNNVGGLVGSNNGLVYDSYSTGNVSGITSFGGLVGANFDTISEGYWYNSQSNCYWVGNVGCPTAASEGAASDFFGSSHAVYNHAGTEWDFATIWNDTGSYPTLR